MRLICWRPLPFPTENLAEVEGGLRRMTVCRQWLEHSARDLRDHEPQVNGSGHRAGHGQAKDFRLRPNQGDIGRGRGRCCRPAAESCVLLMIEAGTTRARRCWFEHLLGRCGNLSRLRLIATMHHAWPMMQNEVWSADAGCEGVWLWWFEMSNRHSLEISYFLFPAGITVCIGHTFLIPAPPENPNCARVLSALAALPSLHNSRRPRTSSP